MFVIPTNADLSMQRPKEKLKSCILIQKREAAKFCPPFPQDESYIY